MTSLSTLQLVLLGWGMMALMMGLLWAIHFPIRNAGIVDFGWTIGLVILALEYAWLGSGYTPRRWMMASVVSIWGMRLALHVLFDRVIGKKEDARYTAIREDWKSNLNVKFFFFFEFQGLLDVMLSTPYLVMALNQAPDISALEWIGVALWAIAFVGELTADEQLKAFKKNPASKGKTCRRGLWNYSRHPNYFFEWMIWVAYFVMACASPHGWISIGCPVLMLYFLFKVTGIPLTEAQAVKSRGEDYREYQRTTSAFVPWFKKSQAI